MTDKIRKQGKCEDCGAPLYGNDYGPLGHQCNPKVREMKTKREMAHKYQEGFDKAVEMVLAKIKALPSHLQPTAIVDIIKKLGEAKDGEG